MYTAELVTTPTLAQLAYDLDQQLGLRFAGNYLQNWAGHAEKWLQSNHGWHFITPHGKLYRWMVGARDSNLLTDSSLVGTLDESYHTDPARLHAAPEPQGSDLGGSTAAVLNGNQIVITPGAGFLGDLEVRVTASDGLETVVKTFTVSVVQ